MRDVAVRSIVPSAIADPVAATISEFRDWLASREAQGARIALIAFAAYVVWMLFFPGVAAHRLVSEIYNIVVPLISASVAWRTGQHPALDRRTQQAWYAIAVGLLMLGLGDIVWFVYDYVVKSRPTVSIADVLYVALYPALFWAFFRVPTWRHSRREILKRWLDVGVVMVTGGAIIWYLILDPLVDAGNVPFLEIVLAGIYPVGDLALLFAAAAVLLRYPPATSRRALQMLAAASVAMFVSDLILGYTIVQGHPYETGTWTDLGWQTAMVVWMLAAYHQRWRITHPMPVDATPPEDRYTVSPIPYIAAIVGYGLLIVVVRPYWSVIGEMMFPVLALTALVLVRQIVAVRENVRLLTERAGQETRFKALVQHASDVITVIDRRGTITFMSPAVERMFGWTPRQSIGHSVTDLVHWEDSAAAATFLTTLLSMDETSSDPGPLVVRCRNHLGEWRFIETIATVMLNDPIIQGIVLNTRDVSDRMALQAELAHQAYHDSLTQLANRRRFRDRVEHALARSSDAPEQVAVFFLDLDHFKNINDSFGHAEGDRLLVEVAGRLLNGTRGSDTVARLGGDEFAILVSRVTGDADLIIIADRLTTALGAPFHLESGKVFSSGSIGIAKATSGITVDDLLRNADVAMYVAKRHGRGGYAMFEPTMQAQTLARLELETELRHAIEREQLVLFFQPIVGLDDYRLLGVESLVRWRHPERGLLMPGTFIPVAEESGLILPLGRWVLEEGCRQGARWAAMHPDDALFTVTINVSCRQLDQPTFVDEVASVLDKTGFPAHRLTLEVTESTIMRDPDVTLQRLTALKALGVQLAIDDFGTGYSSLSFLQQFPVDVLKIDKSFVDRVVGGASGPALAQTIVTLGKTLSLRTIAEGIERRQQADVMAAMGCKLAQGFYFWRPMLGMDIDALLQAEGVPVMVGEGASSGA